MRSSIFLLFLYGHYLVIEFHTNRTIERCDQESGFVGKRIDRSVGTRKFSTSVIQITLKRSSVNIPVQSLFSETGLLVTFLLNNEVSDSLGRNVEDRPKQHKVSFKSLLANCFNSVQLQNLVFEKILN